MGKTALADELRPAVTGRDGWFVAGYRRDVEFDAANQALRTLGRVLLAEPDEELAEVCARIPRGGRRERWPVDRDGAGVRGAAGAPPDAGDPLTAQRAAVAVLRAVASRKRPVVVVFLDDLQWAGRTALQLPRFMAASRGDKRASPGQGFFASSLRGGQPGT